MFTKIGFKFKPTLAGAMALRALGAKLQVRKEEEVIERHVEQAEAVGDDPFKYGRRNRQGQRVADTGREMWGGKGHSNVDLSQVFFDILALGMELQSPPSIFMKDGDKHWTAQFWFVPAGQGKADLSDEAITLVNEELIQVRNIWVYTNNPDGSATINGSAPDGRFNTKTSTLRLTADGISLVEPALDQ